MNNSNKACISEENIIPVSIISLGLVFSLIESIADYALQGGSFFHQLFLPKTPELLTRLFFILISVVFAFIFKEFKKSDTKLRVSEKKCRDLEDTLQENRGSLSEEAQKALEFDKLHNEVARQSPPEAFFPAGAGDEKQSAEALKAIQEKEQARIVFEKALETAEHKHAEVLAKLSEGHKQLEVALRDFQLKDAECKQLQEVLKSTEQKLIDGESKVNHAYKQYDDSLKIIQQKENDLKRLEEALTSLEHKNVTMAAAGEDQQQLRLVLRETETKLAEALLKSTEEHKRNEDHLQALEESSLERRQLADTLKETKERHAAELLKVSAEHEELQAALKTIEQKESAVKQLESSLKELEQKHTAELEKINLERTSLEEALSQKAQQHNDGEAKQCEAKFKDIEQKYQQEVIRCSQQQKQLEDALQMIEKKEAERQKIETALSELHHKQADESSNTVTLKEHQNALKVIEQKEQERKQLQAALEEARTRVSPLESGIGLAGGASLGQVASGISHQIIDPLSVVLNNVKVLKIKFAQKKEFSYADLKEQIGFIEESAVLCKNIISSFGSVSAGVRVSLQAMQLNEVIEKVYMIKNQEFKFKNISFQKQLQQDVPPIMGDALLLQQVVFNLIANAKWAIEQKPQRDGGIIGLGTQHDAAMNKVIVTISDTGIGIKDADLPRIFEPMFSTKKIEEGLGLGLAIVTDIIKAHQATISVESKVGQGATFKISFPALPVPKGT
ncbi:MAG: ATP-binding protein [Candidatus Omnitrophota bacterium]|jgi:signal transduction histidine kinase